MGKGSKAPAGYQPTWQAGADTNYQNLIQGATPWATAAPGATIPGMTTAAGNVVNNPYNAQEQAGAGQVASLGGGYASGMDVAGSALTSQAGAAQSLNAQQLAQLQYLGDNARATGRSVNQAGKQGYAETQGLIPSTTQGASYAPGLLDNAYGLANLTAGTALGAIPGLTGGMDAANQILQTGFDPQGALYARESQKQMDTQNALNSMYGLGSSAYGAGLAGDSAKNFNIDWQNNQLSRETQALGAYGTEQGVVANNLEGLLGSASTNYANLTNAGVNQYTGMTSNAVQNLDSLVNTGMAARATGAQALQNGQQIASQNVNAGVANTNSLDATSRANYDAATQQALDAQQMRLSSSQAPALTYQNQQQAALSALQSLNQGYTQALAPTTALTGADAQYMQLGQGATQNAQNAARINQASASGFGSLIGTVAGLALAPATGGLSLFAGAGLGKAAAA